MPSNPTRFGLALWRFEQRSKRTHHHPPGKKPTKITQEKRRKVGDLDPSFKRQTVLEPQKGRSFRFAQDIDLLSQRLVAVYQNVPFENVENGQLSSGQAQNQMPFERDQSMIQPQFPTLSKTQNGKKTHYFLQLGFDRNGVEHSST